MIPLKAQAYTFYVLCRIWGLMRQYIKPVPTEPEPYSIGISKIWALPDDHPFFYCAYQHDECYSQLKPNESTKKIDEKFLACCLRVCKKENC